ncbi:unnamed protein product [Musa acuminata subsp. malaccensis]|uniref:(wild Malaysian banana) hypothetical protein n=1 Tax=Musa acuminata subsp. malaccensis TaxID=214687 RepID=A0A804JYB9_MUSAM|nr:unnamed protein product [Musa acuminata subsp. malaccensis]
MGGEALPANILCSSNHPHLRYLQLWGPLERLHMDNIHHDAPFLPNLASLFLAMTSRGERLVFPKGGFPRLQYLSLGTLQDLEEWRVEEGAMPCLRELRLWYCNKLRMLPEGLRGLTQLEILTLYGMQVFHKRMQKDIGDDYYKIQHVPSIQIEA